MSKKSSTARGKAKESPACVLKTLPEDKWEEAAKTAVAMNPANAPPKELIAAALPDVLTALVGGDEGDEESGGVQLVKSRLAVMTSKYWGVTGVDLTVGFLESIAADLRDRILSHMNAWSQYANVRFRWTQTSPQIRITRSGDGYWSYLGSDVLHIGRGEPTMSLQAFTMDTPESEYKRVVRHETGHTLGFPHEHLRQQLIARLDPAKVIAWGRAQLGWDEATVRSQILTPLSESSIRGTPDADEDSVMTYQIPGAVCRDGKPIRGGTDIDALDGQFAATLYPKPGGPAPPPTGGGKTRFVLEFAAPNVPAPVVSPG